MKVTKINSTYQSQVNKTPCIQRVKKFFTSNFQGAKIKELLEDVFDRTINRSGWLDYLGPSRDYPNYIGIEEDYEGPMEKVKLESFEFYPEDVEKMRSMTEDEKLYYKGQLIRQKKYTIIKDEDTKNQ